MKHIDLYHKEFQPYRTPLYVRIIQITCICIVFCVIGVYTWYAKHTTEIDTQLLKLRNTEARLNIELAELEQRLQVRRADQYLQRKIDKVQHKLTLQGPVSDYLKRINEHQGNSTAILTTLAQNRLPQVWFTGIFIDNKLPYLQLEGVGTTAESISTALEALMRQQVFAGQDFEHLEIKREKDGAYQFILGSHVNPQGKRQ